MRTTIYFLWRNKKNSSTSVFEEKKRREKHIIRSFVLQAVPEVILIANFLYMYSKTTLCNVRNIAVVKLIEL